MKKIIACGLALAAALSLTTSAFAAEENSTLNATSASGDVEVVYDYQGYNGGQNTYVVTIPNTTTINAADEDATFSVAASQVYILNGKRLVVTIDSKNDFALKNGTSSIPYTCKKGDTTVTEQTEILSVNGTGLLTAASNNFESTLSVSATTQAINGATATGQHTDIITFECAVADVE